VLPKSKNASKDAGATVYPTCYCTPEIRFCQAEFGANAEGKPLQSILALNGAESLREEDWRTE